MCDRARVMSGHIGFDKTIDYLRMGDNVVWQIDNIDDYAGFVELFVNQALSDGRNIVYMRFGNHKILIDPSQFQVKVYTLEAMEGFDTFTTQIHRIIETEGREAFYVFDCLSSLIEAWATDLMIGNFFWVTCPYLFELDTIAYFSIFKNRHSQETIRRIRNTTQILIELYSHDENVYLHPQKVDERYSPTMFLPHIKKDESFLPLVDGIDAAKFYSLLNSLSPEKVDRRIDYWDMLFIDAQKMMEYSSSETLKKNMKELLCRVLLGRDEKIITLAAKHVEVDDLLKIKARMIGTGFIGGKAAGMILARKILEKTRNELTMRLEPHDSFFVGSDVFYTYIVHNGLWRMRMQQKTQEGYFAYANELKNGLLSGEFPEEIRDQFAEMLSHFGQSPIIVRSSSLLEDGYGNAFAGKYKSVFCVNQGTPEERYEQFEKAVKEVYSSVMDVDALVYRQKRGLDEKEELMSLLVQRVSGSFYGGYFMPFIAGVGNSYNSYVWRQDIKPEAGIARLVFGLGTRAVDRTEGDYPRLAALDKPKLQPLYGVEDLKEFSQKQVDLLDINKNSLSHESLSFIAGFMDNKAIKLVAKRDYQAEKKMKELGLKQSTRWYADFEGLFENTDFCTYLQKTMKVIEKAYAYPVDIEFTVNLRDEDSYSFNLLQCRPLQTRGLGTKQSIPENINAENILFCQTGNFMGGSIAKRVSSIVYIRPQKYIKLTIQERYDVAAAIGKINESLKGTSGDTSILMVPGRCGTTTPHLGVPVTFAQICNFGSICEIAFKERGFMPDLSYGSHFFQDLVENDMFYAAVFPDSKEVYFNEAKLLGMVNCLNDGNDFGARMADSVMVCKFNEPGPILISDIVSGKMSCFFDKNTL